MKVNTSIKASLFWLMGSLTLVVCLIFSSVSMLVAYMVEDEVLNRLLRQEARYLQQSGQLQPRLDYMQLYLDSHGLPEFIQQTLAEQPDETEFFTPDQSHYHLRHVYIQGKHGYLLADVSPLLMVTNMSQLLLSGLGALLALACFFSILLAFALSRRTSSPILQLAQQVQRLDEGESKVQLQACEWQNELGYLARTLQKNIRQLQTSLQRESHFTRDVSHELRTPLTIISNALTLAQGSGEHNPQLAEVKSQVLKMQQIVESLLALARAESVEQQQLDLNIEMEQSLLQLYSRLSECGFEIRLDLPASCKVQANRHLLHLLIVNIVENAMLYASESKLLVTGSTDSVCFSNQQDFPPCAQCHRTRC